MSQDRPQQPGKEPAAPPLWDEPGMAPSSLFAMPTPTPTGGELVVPHTPPPVVGEQGPWPPSPQAAGKGPDQPGGQGPDQQPQAPPQWQGQGLADQSRAQLQRLCRHLRATDRCPGQCVLSRARQDRWLRGFPDMR
jgi:hypothetical protein